MDTHKNALLTPKGREMMVRAVVDCGLSKAAAARQFNITPKTVAKWVSRFRAEGVDGLHDRSSRPLSSPSQTAPATAAAIEALRRPRFTGKQIAAELGVSPATVSRTLRRLGLNRISALEPAEPRPGKRGRGAQGKALVVIAAQQAANGIGRIRLTRVADASASSLEAAIAASIELGSQVRTDDRKGYSGLDRLGYRRQIARSSAEVGKNLLPLANRVASLLKRWLLGTHRGAVSAAHLDDYLDEYTFRFNRRTSGSRGLLFLRLMQQAVDLNPVPARELLGGRAIPNDSAD